MRSSSVSLKKVIATPVLPARPVLPIRWMYASIVLDIWKLTTSETFGTSIPRPARSVATSTSFSPVRIELSAASRCSWFLPEWSVVEFHWSIEGHACLKNHEKR